ncbi:lipoprotein insertase outer membrane protein LolB [Stenotrophomonas sp. YIM B06876]|uniref:lipoprotein insertase outer membrane protein LolB n=1 Tax=Stenotrophomonas sp. YIM B06876 TaxID=3060211 RepID=UPI0027395496|nr:lipoprotein insertase outer membrane protein LolB [Stenotrophomonas sp. YIM B06876]
MNRMIFKTPLLALALLALAACSTLQPRGTAEAVVEVSPLAQQAEAAREQALQAETEWGFQGRVAVSKGRNGGSGRIDWQQRAGQYRIQLSAPVTRQSWRLSGGAGAGGRLEGLEGGPREGADAQQLLWEATGWEIPVDQLPDWVRGLVAVDAAAPDQVQRDADGRPRRIHQRGWDIRFMDWFPATADQPALPRRLEAVSGDAKVRLIVDSWGAQ